MDLNDIHAHPEACCKNANIFTARHDALTKCLSQLIKKAGPPASGAQGNNRGAGDRKPDIKVERNGVVITYADVVVASPVSDAALRVAAELAEQRKRSDYEGAAFKVIPFAVESYGRYGEEATRYLNAFAPRVDCSHILAFHLGRAHLPTVEQSQDCRG